MPILLDTNNPCLIVFETIKHLLRTHNIELFKTQPEWNKNSYFSLHTLPHIKNLSAQYILHLNLTAQGFDQNSDPVKIIRVRMKISVRITVALTPTYVKLKLLFCQLQCDEIQATLNRVLSKIATISHVEQTTINTLLQAADFTMHTCLLLSEKFRVQAKNLLPSNYDAALRNDCVNILKKALPEDSELLKTLEDLNQTDLNRSFIFPGAKQTYRSWSHYLAHLTHNFPMFQNKDLVHALKLMFTQGMLNPFFAFRTLLQTYCNEIGISIGRATDIREIRLDSTSGKPYLHHEVHYYTVMIGPDQAPSQLPIISLVGTVNLLTEPWFDQFTLELTDIAIRFLKKYEKIDSILQWIDDINANKIVRKNNFSAAFYQDYQARKNFPHYKEYLTAHCRIFCTSLIPMGRRSHSACRAIFHPQYTNILPGDFAHMLLNQWQEIEKNPATLEFLNSFFDHIDVYPEVEKLIT